MVLDVLDSITAIAFQDLVQFVCPFVSVLAIGANQGVHGKDVHFVITGPLSVLRNLFSQERIGDDVVTADQPGQVEGFGRSIESDRTLAGVFGDGCRRDMAVALENDIRPDFITDD